MNISQQPTISEAFSLVIQQKSYKFHQQLRQKHIEQYKNQIRRQHQAQSNLNSLLDSLPSQLDDVLRWSRDVMNEAFSIKNYKFPVYQIIELFKIVERFPCLQTIQLLQCIAHKIQMNSINQLFQYDIVGLLHKLILCPEKIVPRTLMSKQNCQSEQCMCLNIIKKSIVILAILCQQSQKARNFIVMSHKSFLCLNKAYQKLGNSIDNEFILCIYSFTVHKMIYDEQYLRIIRNISLNFCHRFMELSFSQIILIIKSLTNVVLCKQKWAMDLIQENCRYDILDQVLKVIRCSISSVMQLIQQRRAQSQGQPFLSNHPQQKGRAQKIKQLAQIVHYLNIFLIHYMEVSTNQYFQWQNFLTQWFNVLTINESSFQNARRDVYFIFNNIICEAQEPESSYHIFRSMIFQHNCILVFAKCLEQEINENIIQEVSYCINSILSYKNVQTLADDIISSELVRNCLQAITRNFYSANFQTKESLMVGLWNLINRTQNKQVRNSYIYQVKCYQNKLHEVCNLNRSQKNELDVALDKLLQQCYSIN